MRGFSTYSDLVVYEGLTNIIKVESEVETTVVIPATASGRDLLQAPRQVITRLVLNPGKTQILSQAIYVVEKGAK